MINKEIKHNFVKLMAFLLKVPLNSTPHISRTTQPYRFAQDLGEPQYQKETGNSRKGTGSQREAIRAQVLEKDTHTNTPI